MSVITTHNAGFFSCCAVKLKNIIDFINTNLKAPDFVDSKNQFQWYKNNTEDDITYQYFEHYDNLDNIKFEKPIRYHWDHQFIDYSKLDYDNITPVINKYFYPSKTIINIIKSIEEKYSLAYEDICVLFYRGNDKITETTLCSYNDYIEYAKTIQKKNPKVKFLLQSDETEFIETIMTNFPENSFYFKDEIRHIKKCNNTVDNVMREKNNEFSKYYLAITIIMSKCKYIICGSGNCSEWIMFYRNNNKNVLQYLNGEWFDSM